MSTTSDLKRAVRSMNLATIRRDSLIVRMREEGHSLRQIAAVCQLTAQGVKLICDAAAEVA